MKTLKSICIVVVLFSITSNAQITKGNWMVGGNGSLSHSNFKSEQNMSDSNSYQIDLSPNIGYFVYEKLALGTRLSYFLSKFNSENGSSKYTYYGAGPFVRYYFLKEGKSTNLFLETSYSFSVNENNTDKVFKTKAGTVIFLNSSVGFEISVEYLLNEYNSGDKSNVILLGLGFQIHLKKDD